MNTKKYRTMQQLAVAVAHARAAHKLMAERCNAARQRVLDRETWIIADDWKGRGIPERVTDPRHDYLLPKSDWPRYFAECAEEMRRDGIKVDDPDRTPDLALDVVRVKAENALIAAQAELVPGLDAVNTASLELHEEAIVIGLRSVGLA